MCTATSTRVRTTGSLTAWKPDTAPTRVGRPTLERRWPCSPPRAGETAGDRREGLGRGFAREGGVRRAGHLWRNPREEQHNGLLQLSVTATLPPSQAPGRAYGFIGGGGEGAHPRSQYPRSGRRCRPLAHLGRAGRWRGALVQSEHSGGPRDRAPLERRDDKRQCVLHRVREQHVLGPGSAAADGVAGRRGCHHARFRHEEELRRHGNGL